MNASAKYVSSIASSVKSQKEATKAEESSRRTTKLSKQTEEQMGHRSSSWSYKIITRVVGKHKVDFTIPGFKNRSKGVKTFIKCIEKKSFNLWESYLQELLFEIRILTI